MLTKRLLLIASLLAFLAAPVPAADTFGGKVVGVVDGDTIDVLRNGRPQRIELHGIDCPERGQPYGKQATQAASDLLFGKQVEIAKRGTDRDKHIVADVLLPDGKNVNQSLVLNGWCWWARNYAPNDMALQQAEQVAKATKKGLWADPKPVPPWLYRRLRSGVYP